MIYVRYNSYFMARQEKFKQKTLLCPLASSLPQLHCASALCINQTFPTGSCSTIKSSILLVSVKRLLKDNIPS